MAETVLSMQHIVKAFPGVIANNDVSLEVKKRKYPCFNWRKRCGKEHANERALWPFAAGRW